MTRPTILLVDDRAENLLALRAQLRSLEAELLEASSGAEALELLLAYDVNLAILDIQMPEMDGFQLAELMRGAERTRRVPIIFVTAGMHDRVRIFRGYDAGAVDFLVKPIEPKILTSKARILLQLNFQQAELARRVAELEAAHRALEDSERRFRGLAENIPSILMRFDRQQRVVYLSRRAEEVTGIASSAFLGRTNREMGMPAALCDRWERAIARVFATGISEEVEFAFDPPGEPRHFLLKLAAERAPDGTVEHVLGVSTEISPRKRAEDALRASEARFRLLARTAGRLLRAEEPQRVIDELCHEVMAHLDCQAFFNFMAEPAEGRLRLNAFAGIPADAAAKIERLDFGVAICGCVARDATRILAEDLQHSDDPRAELIRGYGLQAYCCHPLLGQGDRVLGTLSFGTRHRPRFAEDEVELMRAVTDQVAAAVQRMETSRALSITNAQLIEADQRKNEFMATLSHELRNPLAPIKNCLAVLDQAVPGSEQAGRVKAIIDRQVDQLSRLVDDLLDVTRITRNKIHLQRQRLDLGELVRSTGEDYRLEFDKAGVALELALPGVPVRVNADRSRMAQAVGNLLHNAVKFTPRGGRVTATVAADVATRQAVVRVADTGMGMRPELVERLFQPFMQAETTLDRSRGGLGLGLALVKELVELHGGTVEAQSRGPGQGSEFAMRLPLDMTAAEGDEALLASSPVSQGRVLIIEDHADAAESLRELLELEGHEVWVAHNGPAGLRHALEHHPDVVLCDIGLPGMDGYDVARALRAEQSLAGTLLVALTGYALPEDLQRAAEAGFDRHMAKPPSLEHLRQTLAAPRAGG